jgi:hypothetical protein
MTTTSLFTQTGWGRLQTHWSQKTRIQTKGKMKDNKRTNIEKEERQLKTETNKKVKKNK